MADVFDAETRSRIMRAVRSENTRPELAVRSLLHRLGFRFRLRRRDLPGKPDIVLPRYHVAVFVHGCFFHGHDCPRGSRQPQTNAEYWRQKRLRNVERDARVRLELASQGWRVLTVWECELRNVNVLAERLFEEIKGASGGHAGAKSPV
jgi:DNA mismatch endonuclease (patch repair protein)